MLAFFLAYAESFVFRQVSLERKLVQKNFRTSNQLKFVVLTLLGDREPTGPLHQKINRGTSCLSLEFDSLKFNESRLPLGILPRSGKQISFCDQI